MVMTDAEKQRAYRERKKAQKIADELFEGESELTVQEFLDGMEYEEDVFWEYLDGLGEETSEHQDEQQEVWQEAYDETWGVTYRKELGEAIAAGLDPDEEGDDEIREDVNEVATEEANEAVQDWRSSLEDYAQTRVQYNLVDLLAAYRAAHQLN